MDEDTLLNQYDLKIRCKLQGRDYLRCLVFREKLYELKRKLCNIVCQIQGGPTSLNEPYHLLSFIIYRLRFQHNTDSCLLWRSAVRVRTLRNNFYGHIPDLRITDELIQLSSFRSSNNFYSLIQEVTDLHQHLENYQLSHSS